MSPKMCSVQITGAVLVLVSMLSATSAGSLDDMTSPVLQRTMQRMYEDCQRAPDGFSICIKAKLITFLDRFALIDSFNVAEGVKVVRSSQDSPNAVDDKSLKKSSKDKDDWEKTLPRGLEARDEAMTDVLVKKVVKVFSERTLRVELPSFSAIDVGRGLEEGRC